MSELPRMPLLDVPPEAQHRVALLRDVPAGELLIHEIYLSVQGESTHAGRPCAFVRLHPPIHEVELGNGAIHHPRRRGVDDAERARDLRARSVRDVFRGVEPPG